MPRQRFLAALILVLVLSGCASSDNSDEVNTAEAVETETAVDETTDAGDARADSDDETVSSTFTAEVWADNWFALYVNGEVVGEDSVSIATERSFNAETISFEATYPLTIAIKAKDFKETDSGIEYIGLSNQQMGDGGLIAQITDDASGKIMAVTSSEWSALVVHRAPLNPDCEKDADPDATCEFEITETPAEWAKVGFDASGWGAATTWSEADVSPKDGYDEISWHSSAALIWGSDLEIDNTILLRLEVSA